MVLGVGGCHREIVEDERLPDSTRVGSSRSRASLIRSSRGSPTSFSPKNDAPQAGSIRPRWRVAFGLLRYGGSALGPSRTCISALGLPREGPVTDIALDDFARRFSLRGKNLMWFLGAGASASAGVPTAMDLIWEFKRSLFVSQNPGAGLMSVDLSQPSVRNRIDAHIESIPGIPVAGSENEYAVLFETAYPAEADRRAFLDAKLSGAKPSYGHIALATLMRHGHARVLWTTNFDALVADSCAHVYDTTSALTTVDLNSADQVKSVLADERWPIEIKLHGDFRFRRLRNTSDELRHQDARLRRALVDLSSRFGLIVCGYSGRDDSVMDALNEAVLTKGAFPAGLFWLLRRNDYRAPAVQQLLNRAVARGVEAAAVAVESFDETLRDLVSLVEGIDSTKLQEFSRQREPWSPAPRLSSRRRNGWPVVRLNAVPILAMPAQCRRVVCNIGGTREVRRAVEAAGVDVLAVRSQGGVLAFGADSEVRKAFGPFEIEDFDLHSFDRRRLRYESTDRGLLGDALGRAICRRHGLKLVSKDRVAPTDPNATSWARLRAAVGPLHGVVTGTPDLRWYEGSRLRLDWASDQLCLLVEPLIVFEGLAEANRHQASDFARQRTVQRYNRNLNQLLDFWTQLLAANGEEMTTLGTALGVDAAFALSTNTCFSRRVST